MHTPTNLIGDSAYKTVLAKLKHIQAHGLYGADEVHYIFDWDDTRTRDENIKAVIQEDAIVRYFLELGVIVGERVENEFRKQELQARGLSGDGVGVWAKPIWDEADSARKEYEWEITIWGVDAKKLDDEAYKFDLVDIGARLVERADVPQKELAGLPKVSKKINDDFSLHVQNIISYRGRSINLEPQARKIAAAIIERSSEKLYTDTKYLIDNCLSEDYLERVSDQNNDPAAQYIKRYVSTIRAKFRIITHSDQDFFPHAAGLGYKFSP
ncbi:MAG TPA: hypothetical protein VM581_02295 [Magnetospirillaceae bacterium]|nr:hypothetical protein [Magnetospirillaceae bacterium]